MNEKIKYFIVVCIFIIVIIVLNVGYNVIKQNMEKDDKNLVNNQNTTNQNESLNKIAKDFIVYTENGEEVYLNSYKGKPIVINFWTTWCGYCKVEMPYFNNIYDKEKENIEFFMINETVEDKKEEAINYIKKEKYKFPVYYDINGEAARVYKVTGYPITIFINKNFEIHKIYQGAISADILQKYINQIK